MEKSSQNTLQKTGISDSRRTGFLNYVPVWLKSKYLLTGLAFVIWMVFFDRDDIGLQMKRIQELNQLQRSEKNISKQIAETKKELELLKTNPFTLEKYAREKYLMKKDNEDLYIVDKPSKTTQ